jgi:hypothetical protein
VERHEEHNTVNLVELLNAGGERARQAALERRRSRRRSRLERLNERSMQPRGRVNRGRDAHRARRDGRCARHDRAAECWPPAGAGERERRQALDAETQTAA